YLDLQDAQGESDAIDTASGTGEGATEFGLAVAARASGLLLTVNSATLSPENSERIGRMYRTVLDAIASDLDGSARLTYLPDGERERVISWWNASAGELPSRSVSELVSEAAERTPGAVAVQSVDGSLTFAELDERANR